MARRRPDIVLPPGTKWYKIGVGMVIHMPVVAKRAATTGMIVSALPLRLQATRTRYALSRLRSAGR